MARVRVSRDVAPDAVRDLLERVPRACVCFAGEHGPQALPALLAWRDRRHLAGLPETADRPAPGQEVVLLVDEGIHFFDLRAVYVRGTARPVPAPDGVPAGHAWFEVVPVKTVAWDYGSLREVRE